MKKLLISLLLSFGSTALIAGGEQFDPDIQSIETYIASWESILETVKKTAANAHTQNWSEEDKEAVKKSSENTAKAIEQRLQEANELLGSIKSFKKAVDEAEATSSCSHSPKTLQQ